jgi:hypothetical protein
MDDNYNSDKVEDYNVNTYLSHVTNIKATIQAKRTNAYNTNNNNSKGNNCCNFLSSDDWQRIPEDIRKKLHS